MNTSPTHKKAWVFDFDGTLLDSMSSFVTLAGRVIFETYGVPRPKAEELYRATTGLPFCEQLEVLFPQHDSNTRAAEAFEALKLDSFHQAMPFPETIDLLLALQQRSTFVAISSNNSQENVEHMVAQLKLPVDLICGWKNGLGKGDAHFDEVTRSSGLTRDELLFIGDSLHDAGLAAKHGVDFVGRSGTFSAAEFTQHYPGTTVVNNLQELLT